MSSISTHISLPPTFLKRFEDRGAVMRGKAGTSVSNECQWELMLMKAWQEYASSGSDRHKLKALPPEASDPTVMMLEDYVGWNGEPGAWVEHTLAAGFLRVETDAEGGHWLVLHGFFPLNKHLSPNHIHNQALGGQGKKIHRVNRLANADAGKQLNLLMRDSESAIAKEAATPAEKEETIALIRSLFGLLGQTIPPTGFGQVVDRCLADALHVVRYVDEDEINEVKTYIYRQRESAELPKDPERLLKNWEELMKKSKDSTI